MSTYPFDRQFQQRLELIFKKAEFDRMQDQRRQKAAQADTETPKNDDGSCPQKPTAAAPAPKPR